MDSAVQAVQWGTFGDQAVARDYDGDGKTEIAIFRKGVAATDPATWWILQSATGTVRVVHWGSTGNGTSTYDSPVPQDYDGDGLADLTVARIGTGTAPMVWYILQSSNQQVRVVPFGFSTDKPAAGDFDGDGKTDIGVWREGSVGGQSYFYSLASFSGAFLVQPWGVGGDFALNTVFAR